MNLATNAQKNYLFFRNADVKTREAVLANIADHYGITRSEAHAEITDPGAEHLLDYLTGPVRTATYALMLQAGLA
jgi:predicted DsbA family dithiol-disulfide isomerase